MAAAAVESGLDQGSKFGDVLNGTFLPSKNSRAPGFLNLTDVYSCAILNKDDFGLEGLSVAVKYAPSQAYCCFAKVHPSLQSCVVKLGSPSESYPYLVDSPTHVPLAILGKKALPRGLLLDKPMYTTHLRPPHRDALEQVLERSLENALGVMNLELKKNATVDLRGEDLALFRDRLGFVVGDPNHFQEVTVSIKDLLAKIHAIDDIQVKTDTVEAIQSYDQTVCQFPRSEYLHFLSTLEGGMLLSASKDNQVSGYLLAADRTILNLYADSQQVAEALIHAFITQYKQDSVTMTVVEGGFLHRMLDGMQVGRMPVRRFHTTSIPRLVQWNKVHVLNSGMHIV